MRKKMPLVKRKFRILFLTLMQFDMNSNQDPLISKSHAENVWKYIEIGKQEGAKCVLGGERFTDPVLSKGNFCPVTIFADVTKDMRIFQEEIFGSVGCVTPFDTEEEAIALANGTSYGLAGAVFTKDGARAHRVAAAMKAGRVYINNYFSKGMIESPGTGWKESGVGVAGIHKYMISKKMEKLVAGSSVTRAMFEEGKKMAAQFGAENVYDFSLGNPNLGAIEEYERVSERYNFLSEQRADVEKSKSEIEAIIRDLTGNMEKLFKQRFGMSMRAYRTSNGLPAAGR